MTTMTKKIKVAEQSPYDAVKLAQDIIHKIEDLYNNVAEQSDAGVDFHQDGGQSLTDDIADAKILMKRVYSRIVKAQDLNVVAAFKTIARTGKSVTVGSVTVGQETANVVLSFYNKLSAKDKKKFASIKSLEKIVDLAFSGKTVIADGGTWDRIVKAYASTILEDAWEYASDDQESEFEASDYSYPSVTPKLISKVDSFLSKIGKDKVIEDCESFEEDTGESLETYAHYLAMEQMGHGVGLDLNYDYETKLGRHRTESSGAIDHHIDDPDSVYFFIQGTFDTEIPLD